MTRKALLNLLILTKDSARAESWPSETEFVLMMNTFITFAAFPALVPKVQSFPKLQNISHLPLPMMPMERLQCLHV
jgi:hypothetical protein